MSGPADVPKLFAGVRSGDRGALARAITLIESTRPDDGAAALQLLSMALPHSGNALRLGMTGIPGVGKSTLIDAFGRHAIDQGHRVAVLATDPSSQRSGGSILGDKTRMEELSRSDRAFIRPTPSSGLLGGVARRTRGSIVLCEAAGYDLVLVETVGVGQSELEVDRMTDLTLLLMIPGAGDELQGIKKGILELADLIFVNKADLDRTWAEKTRAELKSALHLQRPHTPGWEVPVLTGSAMSGAGLTELLDSIDQFRTHQGFPLSEHRPPQTSPFAERRSEQMREWLHDRIRGRLMDRFYADRNVSQMLPALEQEVTSGRMT
ncbi:MAG TPA: methylmalonyl Co-A mutase-associated GTPase MeaB, partial [Flavobacteriales bacterium]|nr:methylmalonyl Co-A mutase-associated GTPase MeaB [Flavobacteriales bacterium]